MQEVDSGVYCTFADQHFLASFVLIFDKIQNSLSQTKKNIIHHVKDQESCYLFYILNAHTLMSNDKH